MTEAANMRAKRVRYVNETLILPPRETVYVYFAADLNTEVGGPIKTQGGSE